ncbi:MAG: hypothetical protein IJR63_08405 [Synergistaceae bacterium]|nr:hypothetical protein [Synergistaceae bacterium]
MRKIFLALSVISLVIIGSSMAFASTEDEARDALITYSGTEAFANLLPEERRACMTWVAEGGIMTETGRSAVTKLISEAPDAVTPSQRKALLAAASGITVQPSAKTPQPAKSDTVIKKDDNTGAIIVAGIVGIIAGMIIHNNWPRHTSDTVYYPSPAPPHRDYRVPPQHSRPPQPVSRQNPPSHTQRPQRPGPR